MSSQHRNHCCGIIEGWDNTNIFAALLLPWRISWSNIIFGIILVGWQTSAVLDLTKKGQNVLNFLLHAASRAPDIFLLTSSPLLILFLNAVLVSDGYIKHSNKPQERQTHIWLFQHRIHDATCERSGLPCDRCHHWVWVVKISADGCSQT